MSPEEFSEWERRERETIANEIRYAPAYAAMLGETRIQAMKARVTKDHAPETPLSTPLPSGSIER